MPRSCVERELGPIDILVNNAGWDIIEPFLESKPETWDKVIAINYRGVLNCCKAIAPKMQQRKRGKIVSISSDAGRVGSTGEAVYAGCKAAHHRLLENTRARARAIRHQRQCGVSGADPNRAAQELRWPGARAFSMRWRRGIPFRRLGQPEDLAGAVAFFASSDSDYATGQVLSISGGLTMAG